MAKFAPMCLATVTSEITNAAAIPAFVVPFGHRAEQLQFTRAQRAQRIALRSQQSAHDVLIDHRAARRDLADGSHESFAVGDPGLEQVADARVTGGE